jgi:hypothetical protein
MRPLLLVSVAVLFAKPVLAQNQAQVAGYETYAVVAPIADEANAQPFADVHCAKYHRFANFRRMEGAKAIFDCDLQKVDKKSRGVNREGRIY